MVKLMTENDEKEFVEVVLALVKKKSLTVTNIKDAINKVVEYMNNNATLEGELQYNHNSHEN